MENVRPTFGNKTVSDGATSELTEQRRSRQELGAAWERHSNTKDMTYFTIRLRYTREQLLALLEATPDMEGKLVQDLVAFPNKTNEGNPKRPAYRIYPELSNKQ